MKGMSLLHLFNVPTHEELVVHNEQFIEHLTDHLQSTLSFLILGYLIGIRVIIYLHNHKFKLDYELEHGSIVRVYHNERKWLVVNPRTTIEWLDVLFLCFFDSRNNKNKFIDKQEKKRMRIIGGFVLVLFTLAVIWGVIMLFSASEIDVNPFNWLRGYRP